MLATVFPLTHECGDAGESYHIDLSRLGTLAAVETLGLDEIFSRNAVVLPEWAERFSSILPPERIEFRLRRTRTNHASSTSGSYLDGAAKIFRLATTLLPSTASRSPHRL